MSERHIQYGPFAPLLIGLIALAVWFGFQTVQLTKDRETLANARNQQAQVHGNAQKLRSQLDTLAAETAKLAAAGNSNAAIIVNALKQRGITIDPSKAPAPPAPAAK